MEQTTDHGPVLDAMRAVMDDEPQQARLNIRALGFRGRAVLLAWAEELRRLAQDEQHAYEASERRAARDASGEEHARRRVREHTLHLHTTYGYKRVCPGDFVLVLSELDRSGEWLVTVLRDMVAADILSRDTDAPDAYLINSTH